MTIRTDPLGDVATASYDTLGRLQATTSPVGTVTMFACDLSGQRTARTDPLNRRH